jgi:hypothetical protein
LSKNSANTNQHKLSMAPTFDTDLPQKIFNTNPPPNDKCHRPLTRSANRMTSDKNFYLC